MIEHIGNDPCIVNAGYQAYLDGDNNCPYTDKPSRVKWFLGWEEAADDHDASEQALYNDQFWSLDT